ncbi:arginase family protein [Pelosinus sp. sgz500959]|uniref:arginase family protein n=1 Tax=Pelosinus sp. sgz500959 TaxID=3242472 RepID=UPI00366C29B0
MCKQLNLFFPEWQGGPYRQVYDGAKQLVETLEKRLLFQKIFVDLNEKLVTENNIIGYKTILSQQMEAIETINKYQPDSIFTVGGNCSVGIAPIDYLNRRFSGDLAVVWLDAHGDINTPESSLSKYFTGMPIRHLLGEGDAEIGCLLSSTLKPEQIILAGTRSLDAAESEYIQKAGIKIIPPETLDSSPETIAHYISSKGFKYVYVHIDTDVLSETAFHFSAWPSKTGISLETLISILEGINRKLRVVGASLVEFFPCDELGMGQLQLILNKLVFNKHSLVDTQGCIR